MAKAGTKLTFVFIVVFFRVLPHDGTIELVLIEKATILWSW